MGQRGRYNVWLLVAAVVVAATATAQSTPGRLLLYGILAVACVRWSATKLLLVFLALSLALEDTTSRPFRGLWTSPVQHLGDLWFQNISTAVPGLPLRVAPYVIVSAWLLIRVAMSRTGALMRKEPLPVPPRADVRGALVLVFGALAIWMVYGLARQGDSQQAYYQASGLFAVAVLVGAASCLADAHTRRLIVRIVTIVAIYRAGLVVYLYITRVKQLPEPPLFVTAHADSVLWATVLCYLLARLVQRPTVRTRLGLLLGGGLMGFALVVNNRRLAWLVVLVGLLYVVFGAAGAARGRLANVMPVVFPVAVAYAVVAFLAPPARIFAPVQALKSVALGDDSSSVTRNIEDFNLVFTMRNNPPIGTGFGHPYIELIKADDISEFFQQYQYIPHNSVLGLLMWVGPIGLALILLPIVLCMRSAAMIPTRTSDAFLVPFGVMAFTACAGYLVQGWGDIGLQTPLCVALAGIVGGAAIAADSDLRIRPNPSGVARTESART